MKFVKRLTILLLLATIFSCGSSEKVIRDGKVYTIKGNEILSNGANVSENLTSEEKNAIKKMGYYAAYTALGTVVLLSPKKAQATSVTPSPPKRDYW